MPLGSRFLTEICYLWHIVFQWKSHNIEEIELNRIIFYSHLYVKRTNMIITERIAQEINHDG